MGSRKEPGRFHVLGTLKESEGVQTLLGEEFEAGKRLVIKAIPLRQLGAAARGRIEHEAQALRSVDIPEAVPNVLCIEEGELYYVGRPFVEGVTLAERLAHEPLSVTEALSVGASLLRALGSAHERGVLHLSVQPENIVLPRDRRSSGAKLVDFSFARHGPTDLLSREQPAARVRYAAPECLGLVDRPVTASADLYSAGIVLYECLTGRPPFEGTIGEVLRQHVDLQVPGLRARGLAVAGMVDEFIERLLRKDPRERYQSARGARLDLEAIVSALDSGVAEPAIVLGLNDRRHTLTDPGFIGRGPEIQALEQMELAAAQGRGGLVYVEGPSGCGKTRLLNERARRLADRRVWILRGQGVELAAAPPFQILGGVVAGVLARARAEPAFAKRLCQRLGPQRDALLDALPELAPALGTRSPEETPEPEALGELRSLRALSSFLDALGDSDAPALLMLDDVQWADELSLKLLAHWQAQPSASNANRYVAVVLALRPEDLPSGHILRTAVPAARVVVAALESGDIRQLAESMAGPLPQDVIAKLSQLSGGTPFMAEALLRGMVETGALAADAYGWKADPSLLQEAQASRQAAEILSRKLSLLHPHTLVLLSSAAILGKEFEATLAAQLVGMSDADVSNALDEAQQRRLIWGKGEGQYEFVHDQLRKLVLQLRPVEDHRMLHRQAAELLERRHPPPVFELAHHYDAAGAPRRAAAYALAAAEQARARHALEQAERYYRIAACGIDSQDSAQRLRVVLGLGDVLTLRGRYEEAPDWYAQARPLAPSPIARARIASRIGEVAFKSSDYETAFRACEEGLRVLRRWIPRHTVVYVVLFSWELAIHVLHALLARPFSGRRTLGSDEAAADLLAVALYDRLAYLCYFARARKLASGWAALRALNLAETYPPTTELGHEYSVVANIIAGGFPPLVAWSLRLRQKALAIQQAVGSLHGQGQALVYCYPVSHSALRFDEGIAHAREGRKLLLLAGDQWDLNAAYWGIALCSLCKGDWRSAIAECQTLHRLAKAIGDHQNLANALWVWARAAQGQLPGELIDEALRQPSLFTTSRISLWGAKGVQLLGQGQPEAAAEALGEACRLATASGMIDTLIGDVLPWHAAALRLFAEKTPPAAGARRRALLHRALARTRRARLMGRIYPLLLPFALRESGLVAAALGQVAAARRFLDDAVRCAERQGMRLELAFSMCARAEVGLALDWPEAEVDRTAAAKLLGELGAEPLLPEATWGQRAPPSLALVDRFAAVLEKGRTLVSALTRDAVLAAVRDAALDLLRAERCILFETIRVEDKPILHPVDPAEGGVPPALVERAVATGGPVAFNAEQPGAADPALAESGIKSALCVPIVVRGALAYCLYAEHRHVAGLFRQEEERLAEFIATLAGAALENAAGVALLEQTVQQRTRELTAANKELEAFSYSVSHDLRAPLRRIDGFSNVLLDDYAEKLDEEGRNCLHRVRASAQHMGQLIDDMLNLSRLTRQEMRAAPVDLSGLAREALEQLRRVDPDRSVDLVVAECPAAFADRRLLRVALENLLSNAWKFTSKRPAARIEFGTAGTENGKVIYFVRDNGAGFNMAYVGKLFGAFQRLHDVRDFPGTGVGLATVQRIVHRHGGRVWAEGAVEQGATFYFTLTAGAKP